MRLYRDTYNLPHKEGRRNNSATKTTSFPLPKVQQPNLEEYESMTKEELIQALVQARITEARLKKGYEVKGDGSVIQYSSKNTK